VAAPCVPSTTGAVQVTVRSLPVPCASETPLGTFGTLTTGAVEAVVSVVVADHPLLPEAFDACT
jgi:hypothetical protein